MPVVLTLICLAFGALIVSTILTLWNGFRPTPGFSQAAQTIIWLAWPFLLIAIPLIWQDKPGLTLSFRLVVMAAIATPLKLHKKDDTAWSQAIRQYPLLVLNGAAIFQFIEMSLFGDTTSPITPMQTLILICAGFSAGALGEALTQIFASKPSTAPPSIYTYAPLTLMVVGTLLINLKQHGTLWIESPYDTELGSIWLAWAVAWLCPRNYPRIRAVLAIVASVLLILLAIRTG